MKRLICLICIIFLCTGCAKVWHATTEAAEKWWEEKGKEKVTAYIKEAVEDGLEVAEQAAKNYADKKVATMEERIEKRLAASGIELKQLETTEDVMAAIKQVLADHQKAWTKYHEENKKYLEELAKGNQATPPVEPEGWRYVLGTIITVVAGYALNQVRKGRKVERAFETLKTQISSKIDEVMKEHNHEETHK